MEFCIPLHTYEGKVVRGRIHFHTVQKQTLQLRPQLLEDCSKYGVTVQAVDSIWNAGEEVPVQERVSWGSTANQARCKFVLGSPLTLGS